MAEKLPYKAGYGSELAGTSAVHQVLPGRKTLSEAFIPGWASLGRRLGSVQSQVLS